MNIYRYFTLKHFICKERTARQIPVPPFRSHTVNIAIPQLTTALFLIVSQSCIIFNIIIYLNLQFLFHFYILTFSTPEYNIMSQPIGCMLPFPSFMERGVILMSTYEEFMIILATANLIISVLSYTKKKQHLRSDKVRCYSSF